MTDTKDKKREKLGILCCTAASISTTQSGGIPSIPEEEAVLARM